MKKKNTLAKILIVIGVIAAICAAAYEIYRYFRPDLEDEYTDDLDEAFGTAEDDEEDNEDEFEDEDSDESMD